MQAEPTGKEFRSDLQGLRALAVVSVVLYHGFHGQWVSGGFVGVDIFFVISGFLITRTLLREADQDRLSILGFYRRRVRRLFPALVPMLLAALVMGWFALTDVDFRELALTSAATAIFVANAAFYQLTGYFSGAAADRPLLHMWSLSLEEQFYLFYPLSLALVCRLRRAALPALLAIGGLLSLGLAAVLAESHQVAAFYLAPTRAYELVLGSLTAVLAAKSAVLPPSLREGLSLAGLAIIGGSVATFNGAMAFPGAWALIPCVGAALVIFCGMGAQPLGSRLISTLPFRFFGDISYSLYLWHWPLLAFARQWALGEVPPAATSLVLGASVLIATLSWIFLELPFLRGKVRWPPLKAGFGAMAALVAVSGAIWLGDGFPQRFSPHSRALFAARENYDKAGRRCLYDRGPIIPYALACKFGAPGVAPSVAVWSDSQGVELAVDLGRRLAARAAVRQITASGCPPVLSYRDALHPGCARHNAETLAALVADRHVGVVVLAANFGGYRKLIPHPQMEAGLGTAVRTLRAAGKRVVLVEPIPVFAYDPPRALGLRLARGGDPADWGIARARHLADNAPYLRLIDELARTTGAETVRTADLFCYARLCRAYIAGEGVLYFDANHLSVAGARRLATAVPGV